MRKMGKKKKRNRETGGSERGKELAERGRLVGWLFGWLRKWNSVTVKASALY